MSVEKAERPFNAEGNEGARKQGFHRRPNRRRRPNHSNQQDSLFAGNANTHVTNDLSNTDQLLNQTGRSTRQAGHLPPRNHRGQQGEHEQGMGKSRPKKPPFKAEETLEEIKREATRIEKEIFLEISTIATIGLD